MSYCRFENTYRDLANCYTNMDDDLSGSEFKYREKLIEMCQDIVAAYGQGGDWIEDEEEDEE